MPYLSWKLATRHPHTPCHPINYPSFIIVIIIIGRFNVA